MKHLIFLLGMVIIFFSIPAYAWDDEVLFSSGGSYSSLKPNIMILMDNSGSMNTVIFPPHYNPNTTYVGPDNDWIDPTVTNYYQIDSNNGNYYLNSAQTSQNSGYMSNLSPAVTGVRKLAYNNSHDGYSSYTGDIYFYVSSYQSQPPRYPGNLLNYLFYYAKNIAGEIDLWNHFMIYGNWTLTNMIRTDNTKIRIRSAVTAIIDVVHDIFVEYNNDPNLATKAYPNIGVSVFDYDNGAIIKQSCTLHSTEAAFQTLMNGLAADSWTPLCEAYAEVWAYFRLGGSPNLSTNANFYPFTNSSASSISASAPITNWCQKNFIILLTDGESTKDLGLRSLNSSTVFYTPNRTAPWGDPDGDHDNDTATLLDDGTNYLDDLSYYAFSNDLYPDTANSIKNSSNFNTKYKNLQNIITYAVGFTIDSTYLNDVATNGDGKYFTATNYDELYQKLTEVMGSIQEKTKSFASFSAPKYSLVYNGLLGYVAMFKPKNGKNIWDGHLYCFPLDSEGNFPSGINADPISGFKWDAGKLLYERTAGRVIYTMKSTSGVWSRVQLSDSAITYTDLGVANDTEKTTVKNFIYGTSTGYDWKLGDIFHFTPVVVGKPLKWKTAFDESYRDFFDYYNKTGSHTQDGVNRKEVIYAGANDGMLHCFQVGVPDGSGSGMLVDGGEELWAFVPPSLLTNLRKIVPGVTGTTNDHAYFVDGKGIAKDVFVDNQDGVLDRNDWHTILIFSYGMGGKGYCCLDVTNPDNPTFLWEFTDATYMGYTEGRPIIASLANDGWGNKFNAAFLPGGLDYAEAAAVNGTTSTYVGKSFYILKAWPTTAGVPEVIKKFIFGGTTSNPDSLSGSTYTHTNSGFKYCMTASAGVIDYNYDGISEYLYMLEAGDYRGTANQGGRIWRINLDGAPLGWRPTQIFQAPNSQTFYLPGTYAFDDCFNLWILIGTGHRPQPTGSSNPTGQFYGIIDPLSGTYPITTAGMQNITTSFSTPGTNNSFDKTSYKGLYFNFLNTKEMTFEPTPVMVNNIVLFNTFVPQTSGGAIDICGCTGNQFVYTFKLNCSGNQINVTGSDVLAAKIQGYGSVAGGEFKVFYGEDIVGSAVIQSQETMDLSGIFGSIFWLEKKQ